MSTLFDTGLTSRAILLQTCHKKSLELFFFVVVIFGPKMLDTNTFGKPGPSCNPVPMFPLLHDRMGQVSWQNRSDVASAAKMREVEMILSFIVTTSDLRACEAASCVLVCSQLTDTALHGLKDI